MLDQKLLCCLLIAAAAAREAVSSDAAVVYKKVLPDGREVSVVKTTKHENQKPTKADQDRLPNGFFAVGGKFRIDKYEMIVRGGNGLNISAWQKELRSLEVPAGLGFSEELIVHDIDEKEGRIAILFTAQSTDVEIVSQNKPNEYAIRSKCSLFAQSSLKTVADGRLSWIDDLYVLLVSSPGGTEIWRISKDKVVSIYQDK